VKTSVALFDSHVSVREMLAGMLKLQQTWVIVAEAESGLSALRLISERNFDLVVLDTVLTEVSGLEVLRQLRKNMPDARVLVYSAQMNSEIISEAMRCRPHGYVFKHDSLDVLQEALCAVRRGCRYFSPAAAEAYDRAGSEFTPWDALTPQERTVLQMVAEGSSSKEVAGKLQISARTVDHYRARVMQKLGLQDATAITRYAMRRGLIPL
jgi:DNA-binding NarL/FixJ family response regulator